jgi:hypothetical protein
LGVLGKRSEDGAEISVLQHCLAVLFLEQSGLHSAKGAGMNRPLQEDRLRNR